MAASPLAVGVIGCGNISHTYLANASLFGDDIRIVAVADLDPLAAQAVASRYSLPAVRPRALLADPSIDIVLNLTVPAAHVPVAMAAVEAGKHVYLEKPLGLSTVEARGLLDAAAARGLRIGAAPDTFLGAAHQTARRLIDEGAIGRVIGGSAAVMDRGMEDWHPNPAFFFRTGGGPVFDMGPYYLASLVDLLGAVRKISAFAGIGLTERQVGSGPLMGTNISIEVPTNVNALLHFESGADVTFSASWDVWTHRRSHIELYGTEGSLLLPDPNWFGGPVLLSRRGGEWLDVSDASQAFGIANKQLGDGTMVADYRGIGLADLAQAIVANRPHRANGSLAFHVLAVMEDIACSAISGKVETVDVAIDRPGPLPTQD